MKLKLFKRALPEVARFFIYGLIFLVPFVWATSYTSFESILIESGSISDVSGAADYLIRGYDALSNLGGRGGSGSEVFNVDDEGAMMAATSKWILNSNGQVTTAANETPTGIYQLPLTSFYMASGGLILGYTAHTDAASTATTKESYPFMAFDGTGSNHLTAKMPALTWFAQHPNKAAHPWIALIASPARTAFRVPDNYRTGGVFKLLVEPTEVSKHLTFKWSTLVHTSGSAADTSWTNHKEVDRRWDAGGTSPVEITFTISGETLTAGKWIDFKFWRVPDETDTTCNARVLGVAFSYSTEY